MFGLFSKKASCHALIVSFYDRVCEQARKPVFYQDFGVKDNTNGRFDLIVLHLFLADYALRMHEETGAETAQNLYDHFILDMDHSLRESGASDPSMPRRMKAMVSASAGRFLAYHDELASDKKNALAQVIERNIYRSQEGCGSVARALAHYVHSTQEAIESQRSLLAKKLDIVFIDPVSYCPNTQQKT